MLDVVNVTKKYKSLKANDSVCLQVKKGEIALLLGPNGAGKSTLIKCICGLLNFDGEITIGGFNCKSTEAKKLLGYAPESPCVYDYLTVGEHLEFISRAYKVKDDAYAKELLDVFELTEKQNKLGKELSKGMQQKLSLCCALLHKPSLVIFDEPMVGLDPHAIKKLKEIILELKQSGCAVIISTHIIDSVENLWDTAYIMVDGVLKAKKTSGDGEESLEQLFFAVTEGENK
ncbi:MAG: ABC transporter ATP-binding protein [Acutalibacteraceae bacterium]